MFVETSKESAGSNRQHARKISHCTARNCREERDREIAESRTRYSCGEFVSKTGAGGNLEIGT